jgi:hypothetical protein
MGGLYDPPIPTFDIINKAEIVNNRVMVLISSSSILYHPEVSGFLQGQLIRFVFTLPYLKFLIIQFLCGLCVLCI